jgi:hypothetical protein
MLTMMGSNCVLMPLNITLPVVLTSPHMISTLFSVRLMMTQGPTAREVNRDSTSFDRTRAEWSKTTFVSARGKVGGGGDAKANNWLG